VILRRITILSPHLDDAVFSAFFYLSRWSRLAIQLRVMNFFTISCYAPQMPVRDTSAVSFTRAWEDRQALLQISPHIQVINCKLFDAPIRLSIRPGAISAPETRTLLTDDQIETVAKKIRDVARNSLLLAPLAIGDHIDHLAVRLAVTRCIVARRIAFYEDLPYATWTPKRDIEAHVADVEHATKSRLRPVIVRSQHAIWRKRRVASIYKSQITREEGAVIARWAAEYGGGERSWAPANSSAWRAILERSDSAVFQ
jgi:LmbE family N-acetylglucosaminyl deacetylase